MELRDDEAVRQWVDTILDLDYAYDKVYSMVPSRYHGFKKAFHTAYYCKAVLLERQGKITAAIRNFRSALIYDDGCHATYYQLENLKRQETDEDRKRYWAAHRPDWRYSINDWVGDGDC